MTTFMNFRTSSGNLATPILKTIMVKFCRISAKGLTLKFKMLSQPWLWEGPLTQTPQNVQHGTHSGWEQSKGLVGRLEGFLRRISIEFSVVLSQNSRISHMILVVSGIGRQTGRLHWSASILPVHIAPSLPNTQYFSVSQEFWSELIRTTQNYSEQLLF